MIPLIGGHCAGVILTADCNGHDSDDFIVINQSRKSMSTRVKEHVLY